MHLKTISPHPSISSPATIGFISISGAINLSLPISIYCPSGSLKVLLLLVVVLLVDCGFQGQLVVHLDVARNEAEFLFYFPHNLKIGCAIEGISSHVQQLRQVVGNMAAGDVEPFESGFDDIAVEDRETVSDTIASIQEQGSDQPLSIQGHQSLIAVLQTPDIELFEHYFHHANFIGHWVHYRFGEEDGPALGVSHSDLVEGVLKEDFHVLPVFDDALLSGVAELQQGSILGSFISHHDLFQLHILSQILFRPEHGPADQRCKRGLGEVISRKPHLHVPCPRIAYYCFRLHLDLCRYILFPYYL